MKRRKQKATNGQSKDGSPSSVHSERNGDATERRDYIKTEELEAARTWLKTDPVGKRYTASQHILTLFSKGEDVERVKKFIFNLCFDLRQMTDASRFNRIIKDGAPEINQLLHLSKGGGYIQPTENRGSILFYLFYDKSLTPAEYSLYAQCFGQAAAIILSLMQFDLSGFMADEAIKLKVAGMAEEQLRDLQSGKK